MSGFTRNRNSKHLRYRGAGGRFQRPPSLEAIGACRVCKACGAINVPEQAGGFASECRECSEPFAPKPQADDAARQQGGSP